MNWRHYEIDPRWPSNHLPWKADRHEPAARFGQQCSGRERDNTWISNGNSGDGAGLHVTSSDNRIEGNQVTDNDRGIDVDASLNLIIKNSASGNTTNYVFVASNRYGPIIDITAVGTAAVSGNSAADTTTTTHPWANFTY